MVEHQILLLDRQQQVVHLQQHLRDEVHDDLRVGDLGNDNVFQEILDDQIVVVERVEVEIVDDETALDDEMIDEVMINVQMV